MVKKFDDYQPRKVIRRRVRYSSSILPIGLILAIVFLLLSFLYYGSHRVMMSGAHRVMFSSGFGIIGWFYWLLVALIAIILWQALD